MGRIAQGRFQGVSAGIQMAGEIHPLTLKVLEQNQFKTSHLRPKHFQEFLNVGVRPVNYVISFFGQPSPDLAALFPKDAQWMCWHIVDPLLEKNDKLLNLQFRRAFRELETRIRLFFLVNTRPMRRDLSVDQVSATS